MKLEEFITVEEAVRRYKIKQDLLTRLIEDGKIKAVKIDGRLAVADMDVAVAAIQLSGNDDMLVSIKEASRRLGLNPCLVSRWAAYGWLPVLARGSRGAKLVSLKRAEALANLRKKRGKRGRRLIPRSEEARILAAL